LGEEGRDVFSGNEAFLVDIEQVIDAVDGLVIVGVVFVLFIVSLIDYFTELWQAKLFVFRLFQLIRENRTQGIAIFVIVKQLTEGLYTDERIHLGCLHQSV
jgi:hypothetical protein